MQWIRESSYQEKSLSTIHKAIDMKMQNNIYTKEHGLENIANASNAEKSYPQNNAFTTARSITAHY